jgi:DNA-binding NarL/FixJ family response regulator
LIDVVVIDDHPAILAGIQAWFAAADPPIGIVASGADLSAAWTDPGRHVRMIIFDLQLTAGTPAYGDLKRLVHGGRQVIVYSMRDDADTPLTCLDLGAFTYLNKAEGLVHLVAAVHAAHTNQPYVSPSLAGAMGVDQRPTRPRLTPREVDVLLEWFKCESKDLVAHKLGISPHTVASYLDRIRIKYANTGRPAQTKATMVARAIQDGLIGVGEL